MNSKSVLVVSFTALILSACQTAPDLSEAPAGYVATEKTKQAVTVFLVSLEGGNTEGETFGCGDTIVPVNRFVQTADNSVPTTVTAALDELFKMSKEEVDTLGYYSVFPQMNLRAIQSTNDRGVLTVELQGRVQLGGTCDGPRFYEQIEQTIKAFDGPSEIHIKLNGSEETYKNVGKG